MSALAYVKQDMWEFEGLLCLEPTWEELTDQLVVAVDALSASMATTSSAQVTALALVQAIERFIEEANIQISSFLNGLENVKMPSAILNVRASRMHAVLCVPCTPIHTPTRTFSSLWS